VVEYLIQRLHDPKFVASILAAIAAMATVITLAMPLLSGDQLNRRLKSVAIEREKMRQRERERLARREGAASPDAEAVHEEHRGPLQPGQMGRPGGGAREAGPGRLSRQLTLARRPGAKCAFTASHRRR